MHDVQRRTLFVGGLVGGVETIQGVRDHRGGDCSRGAFRPDLSSMEQLRQGNGRHVLHHQEDLAVGGDDVERLNHVRVVDARCEPRFVQEHRDELGVAGVLGVKPLDGHRARESERAEHSPVVNRGHPPGCEGGVDPVAANRTTTVRVFRFAHDNYASRVMPAPTVGPGPDEITKAAPLPAGRSTAKDEGATFLLSVTDGLDAGREIRIHGREASRVLVGKGPTADLKLVDPAVSRRHLALEVERGRLRITDLGSTNGTRLNESEIVDAYARGGELLRIGDTSLRVERLAHQPAGEDEHGVSRFARVIGASAPMRRIYPVCERLAASNVPVIIEGETGTGKEALAEALHEAGPRAALPFVVFDCTTVAPSLVESELFGHERGAFTGASSARRGLFELAEGGTLLIDEIGDLSLPLQSKLLRAVERSEVRRVGASKPIHCNVRLLVATRRDLEREVQQGRFRDDLFHRLAVARIELPPLRKRSEDIPLLARHFWQTQGGSSAGPPADLVERWSQGTWPGNVRELRNAVARRIALGDLDRPTGSGDRERSVAPGEGAGDDEGEAQGGAPEIADVLAMNLPFPKARRLVLDAFVRRYVAQALADNGGNVAQAAAASGIARRYFQLLRERRER